MSSLSWTELDTNADELTLSPVAKAIVLSTKPFASVFQVCKGLFTSIGLLVSMFASLRSSDWILKHPSWTPSTQTLNR